MQPEYNDFTKETIKKSVNVEVEILDGKVIFPAGTSDYTKLQVNNFWQAIVANQKTKLN